MRRSSKYKLLFLSFTCVLFSVHIHAQQRASEKPLTAFYSAEMKKKIDAAPVQSHSAQEKRASEKPLTAFLSDDMQAHLDARMPKPVAPKTIIRASQKPLSVFYSKAMSDKISTKAHALSPAASAAQRN